MNLKLSLFAATLLISSTALRAEPVTCPREGPADQVIACIKTKYQEAPAHGGLTLPYRNLFQVFVHPETGDWTLVETTADGFSRILGAGTDWMTVAPEVIGKGA